MKEILFKGKTIDDHEWVEGFYVSALDGEERKHLIIPQNANLCGGFEFDRGYVIIPQTLSWNIIDNK